MKGSFTTFLWFQRRVVALYLFIMTFITVMMYVEPAMSIHVNHIIYMHVVTGLIFSLYVVFEFLSIQKAFSQMETRWHHDVFIQEGLNEPKTYEQYLYRQFFQHIDDCHQEKMLSIVRSKKEALEFMTSWFHDIKTPIAVSKLIIDKSPQDTNLQSISDEMTRIEHAIEQALYFARTDDFNQDYFISQTQLDNIVRSVIKQHAKIFIEKNIKLDLQVEALEITTDKKWLEYVLTQIISNALKYSKVAGTITIQAEEDSTEVRLLISDNGIGIPLSDLPRIFKKGFTGMNGRVYQKSTGMGLYLAKKLANKLGHELTVTSKEHAYTTLSIHFPKGCDYYPLTKNKSVRP